MAQESAREDAQHARSGILSTCVVDALTAVAVFLIGVVMMVDNTKLGVSWGETGPQSGYFPYHIGAILCIASVAVLCSALFGKRRNREPFVAWSRFRLVLAVLVPTIVYVLLIQFMGIYVASVLFIAGFMRVLGRIGWLKTVLVSVGVNVLLFWMFEVQFMVPLPKGPLEAYFGY
ncbi:tripartite tricarboxylate transporter TctB family protein [Pusillimonas sp. TS35]|uniref:tripartite tricarboxylate transporter TctB family protein n=1 Tax=Paracandidimonas lactea TaxID=2895524 RepID=UPI00136870AE|nr:tripartite tricarboxylate transporter TctB family protein [Paracandidimonas lactea]MYN12923.1 tripartite tricarboxylate transporter TctB family protein [Pusillimonas sp. TS35]